MTYRRKAQVLLKDYSFFELLIQNDLTEVDVIEALLEMNLIDTAPGIDLALTYEDIEDLLDEDG